MTGYYDIVLALIPVALIGITGSLTFVGIPLTSAVPVSAIFVAGLIGHAMFVKSPIDTPEEPNRTRFNAD